MTFFQGSPGSLTVTTQASKTGVATLTAGQSFNSVAPKTITAYSAQCHTGTLVITQDIGAFTVTAGNVKEESDINTDGISFTAGPGSTATIHYHYI